MNDIDFLKQFESHNLDEKYFDHQGHLRLAWLYLSENELDEANALVCNGIKSYAESLGATDKFHLTISDAVVRIMKQRMLMDNAENWQAFLANNLDLVSDLLGILHQHFTPALLATESARINLVKPDIKPF